MERLRSGESLGFALIRRTSRKRPAAILLAHYVTEELADGIDNHYVLDNAGMYEEALRAELAVDEVLAAMAQLRRRAQKIGGLALVPFAAMLDRARHQSRGPALPGLLRRLPGRAPGDRGDSQDASPGVARGTQDTRNTTFCFRSFFPSRC